MTTQTEALTLALKDLKWVDNWLCEKPMSECVTKLRKAITTIKEALAQPKQEQNLKLMPREATPEMLKAMDECSTEGYDERLYEGHAGSVYMAAWDAFHGQHCYCGDITNLGVIHRDDGPCHYPDHKEPEQEPVAWLVYAKGSRRYFTLTFDVEKVPEIYKGGEAVPLYTTPPQRKPLTDEQILTVVRDHYNPYQRPEISFARAIEAAHGIKE